MTLQTWLAYVVTVTFAVTIPGPGVLLCVNHGMRFGLPRTFGTIAGDLSANTVQIVLVSLGLSSALIESPHVFKIIKWSGIIYLLYLVLQQWRPGFNSPRFTERRHRDSVMQLYLQGFLTSAANPKAILFFLALFPQFINPAESLLKQISILGVTVLAFDALSLTTYARLGEQLHTWFVRRGNTHLLARVAGTLVICAALLLSSLVV